MANDRIVTVNFRGQPRKCIAGQLIVKLRPDLARDREDVKRIIGHILGPAVPFRVLVPFDARGIGLIEWSEDADLESVATRLEESPEVVYAEPNDVTQVSGDPTVTPADPLFPQQWSLLTIQAPAAWAITKGSDDVLIAVLDTGLAMAGNPPVLSHEDLKNPGRFFLGGNYISPGSPPLDDHGHGTHVAGIAGAESNNGRGITGINWKCRVLACKIFAAQGGGSVLALYQATVESINFARARGWRLVINYSGQSRNYSATHEEIARVVQDGNALLCAAAGNDTAAVGYPAALSTRPDGSSWYSNILAVSATTRGDDLASFSNRGIQINVAAPGEDILSTLPNYPVPISPQLNYGALSGTSMATPIVSGVAALVWAVVPTLTAAQVGARIQATAVDLGTPGRDPFFGFGRVNALAAVRPAPTPPPPPVLPPWQDPVIRPLIDEWLQQKDRCVKKVYPRCYVDRWGRMCGNTGSPLLLCNQDPTHPPGTDSHWYVWHNAWQEGYYSFKLTEYVSRRLRGESFSSLAKCKAAG